jgi:curved DNA-binding protein CbpA
MSQNLNQSFYDILEVSPKASQDEIHKAFHRAKSTYSPNSPALYTVFSKEEAVELLRMIDEAYATLSNQTKRREYDERVLGKIGGSLSSSASSFDGVVQNSIATVSIPVVTANDLPDFIVSESKISSEWENASVQTAVSQGLNRPKTQSSDVLPSNVGRTRFSHYPIDPMFEEEISSQSIFDGSFLQKIREYKRVTLDQIADSSRIGKHYLMAVEKNNFTALPASVFVRGFVSQIAKTLGLEEKKVVESYLKILKDARDK